MDAGRWVLALGDANADISAFVQHYPHEGADSVVDELGWSSGGSATNVATDLALLGGQVRLLARVGADPAADYALRAAREAGVDLTAIQIDPDQATGLCFAAISAHGERTFFSYRGANRALGYPDDSVLQDLGWLHIAGHALLEGQQRQTVLQLLETAQRQQIACSLDLCLPLVHSRDLGIHALLAQMHVLFTNQNELLALADEQEVEAALQKLAAVLPAHTIVKRGAQGCLLYSRDGSQQAMSAPQVQAYDTTGCGDAFVAGFLYGMHQQWALADCLALANRCGAAAARHVGAVLTADDVLWVRQLPLR